MDRKLLKTSLFIARIGDGFGNKYREDIDV